MAKLSNAQSRKRLLEAQAKFKKVYMFQRLEPRGSAYSAVNTKDMEAVEKIVARCIKRIR